jgi:hypothetical protein
MCGWVLVIMVYSERQLRRDYDDVCVGGGGTVVNSPIRLWVVTTDVNNSEKQFMTMCGGRREHNIIVPNVFKGTYRLRDCIMYIVE